MSRLGVAVAATQLADLLPTTTAIGPLRRRLAPALSGYGTTGHVALTFDDGPDERTTSGLLDCLQALGVHATFFVLAPRVQRRPELCRRALDEGHEIAVHGFSHRPHVLRTAATVVADLRRAHRIVTDVIDVAPRFWRPPHGIATATGLVTARALGMRPVLWTTDARDWRPDRDAATVAGELRHVVRGGDTVLLHEGVQGDWPLARRTASDVLPDLVGWCRAREWRVGPLGSHWTPAEPSWT